MSKGGEPKISFLPLVGNLEAKSSNHICPTSFAWPSTEGHSASRTQLQHSTRLKPNLPFRALSPFFETTPVIHRARSFLEAAAMASDEIVWQIINQQFCAFKLKSVPLASTITHCLTQTNNRTEQPKKKTSAATSTTSRASATASHAPSPTAATPPCAPTQRKEPCTST
jgi:hypothetical protein